MTLVIAVPLRPESAQAASGDQVKKDRVRKIFWLWGVILGLAGCASDQVVIRSLSLVGDTRVAGTSIGQVSLQEARAVGRDGRIFLTLVSIRNRTGRSLRFGPQDVYLADANGKLLFRISGVWLFQYYDARIRGLPATSSPQAISPYPFPEVRLADTEYTSLPLSPAQKGKVAEEIARLVETVFVLPQQAAPGTFLDKGPQVTLGVLLEEVTLQPGAGVSGYVYFYRPAGMRPRPPFQLVIDLRGEVHAFLFQGR
ncbi:MAG: hypothetical protein ACE5JQ_00485 [Candidatus Methylomirabilales bacterium]